METPNFCKHIKPIVLAVTMALVSSHVMAEGSVEERLNALQKQLDDMKKLQNQVNDLKAQLAQEHNERDADKDRMMQATAAAQASLKTDSATTVGGYGEVVYNNFKDSDAHPTKADLRRFVLFFGHKFNDKLSFKSELEIEHAVASANDSGEVEIEQAYLDYSFNDAANLKAGLFLMPLGLLNENHEPPVFYGVNRNEVETRIIPTTWREGGVGLHGHLENGIGYDVGLVTGFDAGKIDEPAFGVRSGHQELSEANAQDLSVYGSVKYTGQPGLLLGAGVFTGNTGQNGAGNIALKNVDARLTLAEMHARYQVHGFDLQALYAHGHLGDATQVTAAIGAAAPDSFYGWYTQAAYHLWSNDEMDFAPFIRYEEFDIGQKEDVASGFLEDETARDSITTVGFNFKPHSDVVLKADYQHYQRDRGNSSFNLGLGYMF